MSSFCEIWFLWVLTITPNRSTKNIDLTERLLNSLSQTTSSKVALRQLAGDQRQAFGVPRWEAGHLGAAPHIRFDGVFERACKNGAYGVGYEVSEWMMMMMMMIGTRTTNKCVLTSMFCPQMMSTDVPTSHQSHTRRFPKLFAKCLLHLQSTDWLHAEKQEAKRFSRRWDFKNNVAMVDKVHMHATIETGHWPYRFLLLSM